MPGTEPVLCDDHDPPYFVFPDLVASGLVRCAFSTRRGGASAPPFDTLNLGSTTADEPAAVEENRRIFSHRTGISVLDLVVQVHGTAVHSLDDGEAGRPEADALVTSRRGVALTLHVADCLSLFLLDPVTPAVGLAHAGWRGTVSDIAGAVLREMASRYGTDPSSCLAGIGPGLGPCCFLVDEDVATAFSRAFPQWQDLIRTAANKWSIDLTAVNRRLLDRHGLRDENISSGTFCTSCMSDLFYSYRRDRKNTGRMAATLMLRE